jgi:hypothetical protein
MGDVTRILSAIEEGDPGAADQILPLVYDELRKLAVSNGPTRTPRCGRMGRAFLRGDQPAGETRLWRERLKGRDDPASTCVK